MLHESEPGQLFARVPASVDPYVTELVLRVTPAGFGPAMRQVRTTNPLTTRQQQIVDAVLEGATNRQIAERLGLSEQTIKNQLTKVYHKLGIARREQLASVTERERPF